MDAEILSYQIKVKGLVQGVGFRPFIYRIAFKNQIFGSVDNRNDGVFIYAQGNSEAISNFIHEIKVLAPEASDIESIETVEVFKPKFLNFEILKSSEATTSTQITEISPDIAVCNDCLMDLKSQNHRINYPFINCTNCGPRFSIIHNLPYDRSKTTMKVFSMCKKCNAEYNDRFDRRFHAQPVACNSCGPQYHLKSKNIDTNNFEEILPLTQALLNNGKVIAVKGIGGYLLICDAYNKEAVNNIRAIKQRDGKPLAVLCSNLEKAKKIAKITETEEKSLTQWRRPIVLLESKVSLPEGIQMGFSTLGIMLPYMPLHHLLFENLKNELLVATSGNPSEAPIFINDRLANDFFEHKVDAILNYNREIFNRCDDSVAIVVNEQERLIRRSRGYAPAPIRLKFESEGILALGAELNNTFCIGKGSQAIFSQHIGDLKNPETFDFFTESIARYSQMFRFTPKYIVCDLHPEYLSTKYAVDSGIHCIKVQHHHAHIASVMAENELKAKVIGLAFDGTGLGTDGKIWGAEFMVCDYLEFQRFLSFKPLLLPGGDKAAKEPWRIALACLHKLGFTSNEMLGLGFLENIDVGKVSFICDMVDKGINCPDSSSMGRVFDAVAALINVCVESSFQAEAPMRLENMIDESCTDLYDFTIFENQISLDEMFVQIVNDINKKVTKEIISSKFHNTIIELSIEGVKHINKLTSINNIALSGGSFQNKYLCNKIENRLKGNGFNVFFNAKVPSNDGGLALGQLAIAAHQIYTINQNIEICV